MVITYSLILLHNKNTNAILFSFVLQTSNLSTICLKNIKTSYLVENGLEFYPSINNTADIYLFDNFLAIFRRQNFIFKLHFRPTIISKDPKSIQKLLGFMKVDKFDKLVIKPICMGEIEIHLADQQYKHYKTTIILKGLTEDQTKLLSSIKKWTELQTKSTNR